MKAKYKELFKNTTIFAIGSIGSKIITALLVPFYTYYLTQDEYGIVDLVFTLSQIIVPFLDLLIESAVLRFGLMKNYRKEDVLGCAFRICIPGFFLSPLLSWLIGFYHPMAQWKWYLAVYSIFEMVYLVQMSYLKISDNNKLYAGISIIQAFVLALLNVIFITVWQLGVKGYLLASIISLLVSDLVAFCVGKIYQNLRSSVFNKHLAIDMLKYSSPMIFNELSWWIIHSSDKIMLERMVGVDSLGIYAVASKIPTIVTIALSFFSAAWSISSIKEYENTTDISFYKDVWNGYSFVLFGGALCLNAIVKPFMYVYVSKTFFISWQYAPFLIVAAVYSAISSFYGSLYSVLKKSVNCMWSSVISAIVNIFLNYYLISKFEIWGAVIASAFSCIVCVIIRYVAIGRLMKFYPDYKLLIGTFILIGQTIFVSADWHQYIASVIAILTFCVIYNKQLLKYIALTGSYVRKTIQKRNK